MRFSDILGNEPLKERLKSTVQDGRISHAQLFSGKQGSGSLQIALAYAAYIQCEQRTAQDSCGSCPSCIKHNKLVHPDLHFSYPIAVVRQLKKPKCTDFIEQWRSFVLEHPYRGLNEWLSLIGVENKQGNIPVEESGDIVRKLSLKSYESKFKIQLIWLPEKMAAPASNKLLKIIEEPPDHTLFLLITENPESLLATIRSRTQMVKVNNVDDNSLMRFLSEKSGADLSVSRRVAHLCDGDIGKALDMINYEDHEEGNQDKFISWMRLLLKPMTNYTRISAWVDEIAATGRENQKAFLKFCLETTRECLVVNHGDASLVRFDNEVVQNFDKFSRYIHAANAPGLLQAFDRGYYAIERNANPKILFLDLSFRVSKLLHIPITESAANIH
jgi:DNA polymerase-3 subunit delta'